MEKMIRNQVYKIRSAITALKRIEETLAKDGLYSDEPLSGSIERLEAAKVQLAKTIKAEWKRVFIPKVIKRSAADNYRGNQ